MNQFTQVMSTLKIKSAFFACSLFCLLMASNASAQIGKRIQERIKANTEKKVEDKVVDKADKKSDEVLDKIFKKRKRPGGSRPSGEKSSEEKLQEENGSEENGSIENGSEKSSEQSENSTSSGFNFGGMMNATYESSYELEQEFKIEITSREKPNKKEEVMTMNMHYGKNCYMMVTQDENGNETPMKTLMDLKNNSSLMLNDEDMSGMAISMDFMTDKISEAIENDQDTTDVNYTFKKTGKTKMIAGYLSEEYFIETDENTMNIWYTDDISVSIHQNMDQFAMFGSFSGAMVNAPQGHTAGMMMESHMVEKTGKKGTFDYVVKEVNLVPSTINMSNYTMGMGGM